MTHKDHLYIQTTSIVNYPFVDLSSPCLMFSLSHVKNFYKMHLLRGLIDLTKQQQRCCSCGGLCSGNRTLQSSQLLAYARISSSHIHLPSAKREIAVQGMILDIASRSQTGHLELEDLKLYLVVIHRNMVGMKPPGCCQIFHFHDLPAT